MKVAETLFAAGLFCAALGAGLCQFVMIGLIGVGLFPIAFVLLLSAGALAQTAGNVPFWQRGAGLAVYLVGVLLLLAIAGYASSLAYNAVMSTTVTTTLDWGLLGLFSLAPTIVIALGLRYRTKWSWSRCAIWGAAAWCVLPMAVIVFWVLAPVLPLTA